MQEFLLAIALIGLAIGGFAIKMFFKPGETFKKACASQFDAQAGVPKKCACAEGRPEDCDSKTK